MQLIIGYSETSKNKAKIDIGNYVQKHWLLIDIYDKNGGVFNLRSHRKLLGESCNIHFVGLTERLARSLGHSL